MELQFLARLDHPNIVHVYGGCMLPPDLFVVQVGGDACAGAGHTGMCGKGLIGAFYRTARDHCLPTASHLALSLPCK